MNHKAALYARVSTKDKGQDPENQFNEFQRYCQSHSAEPLIYREQETGTGKRRRPVFEQMLKDAEARRFTVLVVWALDRLSREGPLKTMLVLNRLYVAGVKVKSMKEPWLDPDSPLYELMVPILAWIAKQEADRISERVCAGLETARAKGKRIGRPRVFVNLSKILQLRQQGCSWAQITAQTGISKGTAQRAMASLQLPKTPARSRSVIV